MKYNLFNYQLISRDRMNDISLNNTCINYKCEYLNSIMYRTKGGPKVHFTRYSSMNPPFPPPLYTYTNPYTPPFIHIPTLIPAPTRFSLPSHLIPFLTWIYRYHPSHYTCYARNKLENYALNM